MQRAPQDESAPSPRPKRVAQPEAELHERLRSLRDALRAAASGDLSVRLPTGEGADVVAETALAFNALVEHDERLVRELERVARDVGRDGQLSERASLGAASGGWASAVGAVNALVDALAVPMIEATRVLSLVAAGELSEHVPVHLGGRALRGDCLQLGRAVNAVVDQLRVVSTDVCRVAREIGVDGRLGTRASAEGAAGAWRDLIEQVNVLASNLTAQVRNIALVSTAIAKGDLSQKVTADARGEFLDLKNGMNSTVDQLRSFAAEIIRVAREVGTEGRLGAQADVRGVSGVWQELTDSVNRLASNLTSQVRNIAHVATAIAVGDLSQKITVEAKGEILDLKDTLNSTVDQLRSFASEVTRVAREVGTEGRLGAQAEVLGVSGTWKDLTDTVNMLAGNLTDQVRNVAAVATAIANGDLSQKISVEAKGEILELKNTINAMVDRLQTFASEVTRVAREVGTEGKLGGQADVKGVSGTWKDLTDNVNLMARNLTDQVRGIAKVVTAVATGDLSPKFVVEAKGEIAELADTINAMTDKLRTFAEQVTTVAREVGIEGKLGGQAKVPGVAGTWQELTENVNMMAGNLTSQVRGIARVVTAVAGGDLGQRLVLEVRGEIGALAETINAMTDTLRTFAEQVTTVAREVGIEGKLGGQALVPGAAGTWRDLTDSVNMLAGNLTSQVRNIALVTTAVANGDLSKMITVEAKGEILELKDTINAMVERLRTFAAEVTRVAREVGTEGQLGGQAAVPGVSGTWKDLTDNVNVMAGNLTDQVRGISDVVTAVAKGQLTRRLVLVAKGEIGALADTINDMTDTLRTFAEQVTSVAREVGIEGRLGGQAKVPGAAGTWRDLVDNVNELAGNLTTQVRAIFEVAAAVTKGDLSQTIDVEARGEVLSLKDTINQMITNLRDTTRAANEQDWLKTNLARFSSMMQGQRSLESLARLIMSELTPGVSAQLGTFFVIDHEGDAPVLKLVSTYGYTRRKHVSNRYVLGEGLVGQVALEKKPILLTHVPDDYVPIASSLGEAPARNLLVLPIVFEDGVRGVIELGSFAAFTPIQITFLEQLASSIGVVCNMISASHRTEELLDELKRSNAELETRSSELEDKARLLETRNREIADASANLEQKAKQLALVSKYKSEFLANMSHELRTPLNSIMVLASLLAENATKNLTRDQVECAETVYSSGRDLLTLINQILDLSKIESGRMEIERQAVRLDEITAYVEQQFRPIAREKDLAFAVSVSADAPQTILTDPQRLQQILRNLLSNAVKFTEKGSVELRISTEKDTRRLQSLALRQAPAAVAFAIVDTGIGISGDKQELIFEAFQQADTSTSRLYGGTGLGLTISRDLAGLLGGEIHLESTPGVGSVFTLYLPLGAEAEARQGALRREPRAEQRVLVARTFPSEEPRSSGAQEQKERPERSVDEAPEDARRLSDQKVLIVDDDVRNLFAVSSLLERYGAEVLPVGSAKEAFSTLEKTPDATVVLMDTMMPEMDGYEATRRLREDPRYEALPVIALTAKAMPGDRERALEAGCNDFVSKPAPRGALIEAILRATKEEPG